MVAPWKALTSLARDLERWDRIDVRMLGEQQRVVAQRGVAAVGLGTNHDVAV